MRTSPSRSFKAAAYAHLAEVGKALSSATRLELLELLAQAPRSVEALAREVDQSVANTSHHLQALKRAQLVRSERDGLRHVYSLAGEDVGALLAALQSVAAGHVAALEKLTREYFADLDGLEAVDPQTLLRKLRDDEAVLLDVRSAGEFEAGHLPGALSIPHSELEARFDALPRDRTILAYCRGPFCALAADAVRRLRELGFDARRAEVSVQAPPTPTANEAHPPSAGRDRARPTRPLERGTQG